MKWGDSFASVILLDSMQNLNLTTGNVRGSPTKGQSTKLLAYNLQKCQCHEGQGKIEELFQTEGDIPFEFPNVTSWLPHLRFQTLPCQYFLCPIPCILFLHNISQFLIYYMFFPTLFVSFTRMKAFVREGTLVCLAHHCACNALNRVWHILDLGSTNKYTHHNCSNLSHPQDSIFKRLIHRESLKIHKKYNNPIENG